MKSKLFYIIMMAFAIAFSMPVMAQKSISVLGPATPTRDGNVRVSPDDGVQNVVLGSFQLKAEGGNCDLVNVTVQIRGANFGSSPTTLKVFEGNTLISSVAVQQLVISIPLASQVVPQNTSRMFTVKGDFPSTTAGICQVQIVGVRWLDSANADTTTSPSGGDLYGPTQHFFNNIADLQLASVPTANASTDEFGYTTQAVATFNLNVTALGANLFQPVNTDAVVVAKIAGTGETIICPSVSIVTIPNSQISDGSTATVTITAMLPASSVPHSGVIGFALQQFTWHSSVTSVAQTWGFGSYVTPVSVNFQKNGPPPPDKRFQQVGSALYTYLSEIASNDANQLVGEGGSLVFTPTMSSSVARVVFANNSPARGNTLQVGVSISDSEMTPFITAPIDLTKVAPVTYVNYPITNVQSVSANGIVVQKIFDVVLGEVTVHGQMVRTGSGSCEVKFYWGAGSSSTSAGAKLDLLNLSPGEDGKKQPQRFKLETVNIKLYAGLNGSQFDIDVYAVPGTFQLLVSSDDMKTWTAVSCIYGVDQEVYPLNVSVPLTVTVATKDIINAGLSTARCFFKVSVQIE